MHLAEFKAKVGLEAVRGVMTINEIGQAHGVHPVQMSQWKKEIQEQTWQCALAGVSRVTVYVRQKPKLIIENDEVLKRLIDEEYPLHPFYGNRKMVVYSGRCGHTVNRKRAQRLMRTLGLQGMAPGPKTSRANPQHKVYPYLRRGVPIDRPNQVWSTDITYIRLDRGFVYLVAIIDWYSRKVLSWRISNSMEAVFCVDCLEDALRIHGKPEVFNSDQGSQFTSAGFTGVLKREGVTISMNGRGRAFDNIFVERLWRSVKGNPRSASPNSMCAALTKAFIPRKSKLL